MLTIALLGHTGNLGSPIFADLIKAHQSGQIKLIVIHRASSDLTSVPADVEKRQIYLESGHLEHNQATIKGINVVM